MEGRKEEPEIINVWELMSGLDDDELSPRWMSFPAIQIPKRMVASPDLAAKLLLHSFKLELSNEQPKHPWQPSLSKVDKRYARSSIVALEEPVARVSASSEPKHPRQLSLSNVEQRPSLFGSLSGSDASSFDALADNFQRSLSFKLGLEDTVFSGSSKDHIPDDGDLPDDEVVDSAPIGRSSESYSMPLARTTTSRPLSSTTSKLKKWFKANKGALKLQNAIRGGSKQESRSKKLPSSGNSSHVGSTKTVSESGSSSKASESGSSHRGSYSLPMLNGESVCITGNVEQIKCMEIAQGSPVHCYRHSFPNRNQNRGSAEEGAAVAMNRPSSWELEKVVTDSRFKAVLFSTNLRTDINAYEDSNAVRAILISLVGAAFDEKCVPKNSEYERELKNALNLPVVAVPTICVGGKYIAGIDNIMQFFKKGILGSVLLETLPPGLKKPNAACLCKGGKFLICPICKGKRKIMRQGEDTVSCRHCIGTGLLKCPGCPR